MPIHKQSIIRQRKKHLLLAGLAGAAIAAALSAGIILFVLYGPLGLSGTAGHETAGEKYLEVWKLSRDMTAGDTLSEPDLVLIHAPGDCIPGKTATKEEILGKSLRLGLQKGTILTPDFIYEGEVFSDDRRLHDYGYIRQTDKLQKGNYVDVRISFPNGEDCVVLAKKKVMDLVKPDAEKGMPASLWLEVNEEEILRLSSAAVDAYLWEGTSIYAIRYLSDTQKTAVVTYPVNDAVAALMRKDPNIHSKAEAVLYERLRKEIEAAVQVTNDSNMKFPNTKEEEEIQPDAESTYPDEPGDMSSSDDIIYLD